MLSKSTLLEVKEKKLHTYRCDSQKLFHIQLRFYSANRLIESIGLTMLEKSVNSNS